MTSRKRKGGNLTRTLVVGFIGLVAVPLINPSPITLHPSPSLAAEPERHLKNIRQLTAGGQNAEAYFSFDGAKLIFQSTNTWTRDSENRLTRGEPRACYQMYVMDLDGRNTRLVSTGAGATTCGYFFPGDRRVLYSSTHLAGPDCPPKPAKSGRYRWALDNYDIFSVSLDGQRMHRLTATSGYDAEATISPDGKTIVFTSVRDGDLDVYAMNLDGAHVRRLTDEVGYDGGPFFSPDSRRIVYRASHPQDPAEVEQYKTLLAQHVVEPGQLDIFVMNADGTGKRQVTANGGSNFAPVFLPDGRHILFSSNLAPSLPLPLQGGEPPLSLPLIKGEERGGGRPTFHLYVIGDDGTGLEQVTQVGAFNSFPMFSPDGRMVVWVSDRHAGTRGEFNVFLADWMP